MLARRLHASRNRLWSNSSYIYIYNPFFSHKAIIIAAVYAIYIEYNGDVCGWRYVIAWSCTWLTWVELMVIAGRTALSLLQAWFLCRPPVGTHFCLYHAYCLIMHMLVNYFVGRIAIKTTWVLQWQCNRKHRDGLVLYLHYLNDLNHCVYQRSTVADK